MTDYRIHHITQEYREYRIMDGNHDLTDAKFSHVCEKAMPYLKMLAAQSKANEHHLALKYAEEQLGIKTHCPT